MGVIALYNEPCLPYISKLFRAHFNVQLRTYVSQAMHRPCIAKSCILIQIWTAILAVGEYT